MASPRVMVLLADALVAVVLPVVSERGSNVNVDDADAQASWFPSPLFLASLSLNSV
jgi:hypothetical protein